MWTPNPNPSPNPNPKAEHRMPNRIRTPIAIPTPPAALALGALFVPVPSSISSPFSDPLSSHSTYRVPFTAAKMDRKIPISDVKRNCLIIVNQWKVASGRLSRLVATRVAPGLWQLRKSFEINKIWHRVFFSPFWTTSFGQFQAGPGGLSQCRNELK